VAISNRPTVPKVNKFWEKIVAENFLLMSILKKKNQTIFLSAKKIFKLSLLTGTIQLEDDLIKKGVFSNPSGPKYCL